MRNIKNAGHDDWRTPPWLFRYLDTEFKFDVDAAASRKNSLCRATFTKNKHSALKTASWSYALMRGYRQFFMNPPFNNIAPFLHMALAGSLRGATVVCLLPARVEVAWAHGIVYSHAREIRFIRGRVRYYHSSRQGRPNFPSMIVVFGPGVRRGPLKIKTIER